MNKDRIVLFAKPSGPTSFQSLYTIKNALGTTKVGHTGTLDSFASGLLVVCTGCLTRLAGRITEMDKRYEAVIKFGCETDTLECTGNEIESAPLPTKDAFLKAFSSFKGELKQTPPIFSALHIDGKRLSDVARSGGQVDIPQRDIKIFESSVIDLKCNNDLVEYAHVSFHVSKGTYIRSLARDIALACNSRGHLVALRRTSISDFNLKDASGYDSLSPFTIEEAIRNVPVLKAKEAEIKVKGQKRVITEEEKKVQEHIKEKALSMNPSIASLCGFASLYVKDEALPLFRNGAKLHSDMFTQSPFEIQESMAAVFTSKGELAGLLEKNDKGYFRYSFVNSAL